MSALGRLVARLPGVSRSLDQVERYAAEWLSSNEVALAGGGPLWVVLGDSAAQGVGAATYDGGYVGVLRRRLDAERAGSGPWRVVNLSRSGARTREVCTSQLARLADLPRPELVTAVVGGNDAVHTPLHEWLRAIDDLCAGLPPGSVVATVSRGVRERRTRRANEHLRSAAERHGLRVADIWARTGPPWRGKYADGFHPNERGYGEWVAALAEALGLPASSPNEP